MPPPAAPVVKDSFPIVLILIDALRADRINLPEGQAAIAPNLAGLAQGAVTFRNAFSSAPKTIPSVPQLFTSRYFPDIQHDVTLISMCKAAGYDATAAFIHNPYVSKWLGRLEPTFDRLGGGDFDAAKLTNDAEAWLRSRPGDHFALYMHYLDVHTPLKPPPDLARRFVDPAYKGPIGLEFSDTAGAWGGRYNADDQKRIGQLYDASLAATDAEVGRLLRVLGDEGLYDKALIVVLADHGEEMWDHGSYFHGQSLYDELLHIPLMVKFPGGWMGGTRIDSLVRSVDVLPTIADLLARREAGFDAPESDGESLVPLLLGKKNPRTLFATVGRVDDRSPPLQAVRSEKAKLIVDMRTGEEQLFDLAKDPGERENVASKPEQAATLDSLRRELVARMKILADTGIHARITNGTASPIRYSLDTSNIFGNPIVNIARFGMEADDVLAQTEKGEGVTVKGTLAPGDSDEVRFDLLSTATTVTATLKSEGDTPVELCIADDPECAPAENGKAKMPLERLAAKQMPARHAATGLQMQWWSVAGSSEPIAPVLTPADRERLRALGYAE